MKRALFLLVLLLVTAIPEPSSADVISDATSAVSKLSPINIALKGLIGEAAEAGNTVLQQRLQQLQGIVELAIFELDQVAKKRIDQIDENMQQEIASVNKLVQQNLLQFDSLVGKHLRDLNSDMTQRIDQFNFGTANTIASVSMLNTIPLIAMGANGITALKQSGRETIIYIVGSGLKKSNDKPAAFLAGDTVTQKTFFGGTNNEVALNVRNASMGLLEIVIPNSFIPDAYGPAHFSLSLKLREGSSFGFPKYHEQSVPLHICGKLPRLSAKVTVWASGLHYVRTTQKLSDLIHAGCRSGNTNDHGDQCLPDVPPSGWDFDMSFPDYGIIWGSESHNGYHSIGRFGPGNRCVRVYCDGTEGDAHQNIQGIQMKLMKLEAQDECVPKWNSASLPLSYGKLNQVNLHAEIVKAVGGDCSEAASKMTPSVHVAVQLLDEKGSILETRDLREEMNVEALNEQATFVLHSSGLLDMRLDPSCTWKPAPAGN